MEKKETRAYQNLSDLYRKRRAPLSPFSEQRPSQALRIPSSPLSPQASSVSLSTPRSTKSNDHMQTLIKVRIERHGQEAYVANSNSLTFSLGLGLEKRNSAPEKRAVMEGLVPTGRADQTERRDR
ncbi:hypothetical protein IEQ34_023117 [Dendrobium chrysotoxum]|uniref:Uncharacterized protein n=1 Tax=Dendrobium chrysotoxum TaxID=161865 RepID=A0AAV7G0Y7_DENCH|nr:hypothetical protein IEQ34_023117 [Dendrobium chrysotoxum]